MAAARGDHAEMGRWQVLDGLSEVLVTAASSCSTAVHADQPSDNEDLLTLYSLKEQVEQQQMELQSKLAAIEESTVVCQEDKVIETSKELQNEIEFMKESHHNKSQALRWIQLAHSLRTSAEENGEDSKLIQAMIKHMFELCSSILKTQEVGREMEENVIEIRKNRLTLKETERALMAEIQTIKNQQKEELKNQEHKELKRLQKSREKEIQLTTLLQKVFQQIVVGSRVNWQEDPKLSKIILKLEKNAGSL